MLEKQFRAARRAFLLGVIIAAPYFLASVAPFPYRDLLGFSLLTLMLIALTLVFLPIRRNREQALEVPVERHDEADTVFARIGLRPGTEPYKTYYARRPELEQFDDMIRRKWGLHAPRGGSFHHPRDAASNEGMFHVTTALCNAVDGPVRPKRIELSPHEATRYLKQWGAYLGAHSIGIARLHEYAVYAPRSAHNTSALEEEKAAPQLHAYVIVLTVEMDHDLTAAAPRAPATMESTREYVKAAVIAVQIAAFIRNLGYPARAHIFRNNQVLLPLVARDAGLGEVGRMGLLMTPDLGPRVRIAAVTTDLPLVVDAPQQFGALSFCERCSKCADSCPASAIPRGAQDSHEGAKRWKIDHHACIQYWVRSGGYCGRCVAVCPYSHPNTLPHRIMRRVVRQSATAQILALALDDFLYGTKPTPAAAPPWLSEKNAP